MSELRVGCGLFGIYAGKVRTLKDGTQTWVGEKTDVTEDAIGSVAQYFVSNGKEFTFGYKGRNYVLKVEELKEDD